MAEAWHVIEGADVLALLRRAASGEDPDLLYIELYANGEHEKFGEDDLVEVHPSGPHAGPQAGLSGPSGSPTSSSPRVCRHGFYDWMPCRKCDSRPAWSERDA